MSEPRPGKGKLYLVPVGLGTEAEMPSWLPSATLEAARALRTYIAEDARSARRFLKSIDHPGPLQALTIRLLNEHTREHELDALLAPLLAGEDCGLVSEAGCPAVADPGARLIRRAHAAGIAVEPLVGPSSILLALMASGMDGQHFAFHGYLPVESAVRASHIRQLDAQCAGATQIFIETPYRNDALLQALLEHCRPDTQLCIAADLTRLTRQVETRPIAEWRKKPPVLNRRPAVFLIHRD